MTRTDHVLTGQPARSVTDGDILEESQEHPERLAALFDTYHGEIYRYVASRLDKRHADDLAAETFLVAFRGRAGVATSGAPVRAWLYGIATNLIRRHRRDEERKYRALARADALNRTQAVGDDHEHVLARVTARSLQRELGAALRRLRPGDRDVLLLIAHGELSYAEVAAALGIREGSVASRLNRARKTVRAALSGVHSIDDQPGVL